MGGRRCSPSPKHPGLCALTSKRGQLPSRHPLRRRPGPSGPGLVDSRRRGQSSPLPRAQRHFGGENAEQAEPGLGGGEPGCLSEAHPVAGGVAWKGAPPPSVPAPNPATSVRSAPPLGGSIRAPLLRGGPQASSQSVFFVRETEDDSHVLIILYCFV